MTAIRIDKVTSISNIAGARELLLQVLPQVEESGYLQCDSSMDYYSEMNNSFTLYEDDQLVSIIVLFAPNSNELEISALTHPDYRRKGYFTKLYMLVLDEIKRFGYDSVLFVRNANVRMKFDFAKHIGGELAFSEYVLGIDPEDEIIRNGHTENLSLRLADIEDLEQLIDLNIDIFGGTRKNAESMSRSSLTAKNKQVFLAVLRDDHEQEVTVGICAVAFNQDVYLYSLGIIPSYRGKGLGKAMLLKAIDRLRKRYVRRICLEVDSTNIPALNLYQSIGMKIISQNDYYRLSIDKL